MTIGIVMANRNYARWINDAIQSIYDQSHQDWLLYVMDYGSTDGSISTIQAWEATSGGRVKLYAPGNPKIATSVALTEIARQADAGGKGIYPLKAHNVALRLFKGNKNITHVLKFDPDDILLDGVLAEMFQAFKSRTRLVFSDFQLANQSGSAVGAVPDLTGWYEKAPEECLIPEVHIIRRDALDALNCWEYNWADYGALAVWERILRIVSEYGPEAIHHHRRYIRHDKPPRAGWLYRQHSDQLSQTMMVKQWQVERDRVSAEYWSRVEGHGGLVRE